MAHAEAKHGRVRERPVPRSLYQGSCPGAPRARDQIDMIMATTKAAPDAAMRLFDTFEGIPNADPSVDMHHNGDFGDTSIEAVRELIKRDRVSFHQGEIPWFVPSIFDRLCPKIVTDMS